MAIEPQAPHAHDQPRFETRDASTRGLIIFFIFIGLFLVLTSLVVARFFGHLTKTDIQPSATSQPFENARPLPPAPLLQAEPTIDIQHYVESQQTLLDSYGWVDRPQWIVRIPIERAMQLLQQKGFPVRPQQDNTQATAPAPQPHSETGAVPSQARTANRAQARVNRPAPEAGTRTP